MANALYALGREAFLGGDIDWDANDIKICFTDHTDDTPNVTTDDYYNDISAGTIGATGLSGNLASKTKTLGVADAADITLAAVVGDAFDSISIFQDTGNAATSHLIAYIDTATGLPCTPSGGDITVVWDAGASKIFAL